MRTHWSLPTGRSCFLPSCVPVKEQTCCSFPRNRVPIKGRWRRRSRRRLEEAIGAASDRRCNRRTEMTFSLKSSAFGQGDRVPDKYTPDGGDLSPPLEWSDPPAGTKSFALIVDDP